MAERGARRCYLSGGAEKRRENKEDYSLLLGDYVCGITAKWYANLDTTTSWSINKRKLLKRFDSPEMRVQIYREIFSHTAKIDSLCEFIAKKRLLFRRLKNIKETEQIELILELLRPEQRRYLESQRFTDYDDLLAFTERMDRDEDDTKPYVAPHQRAAAAKKPAEN